MKATLVLTAALAAFACTAAAPGWAAPAGQAAHPAFAGARLPDGKPNWTGFWVLPGGMQEVDYGPSGVTNRPGGNANQNVPQAPTGDRGLKSPYKEKDEKNRAAMAKGELPDLGALCTPNGMPRMMGMIYGMEILQTPKIIAITSEYQGTTRRIWMNLTAHPPAEELDDTYAGHSIGHWEGDTLVVDTVGIREDVPLDRQRMPHSPKLHIVERFTQKTPGMLTDDMTIEDPDALVKPITQTQTYRYRPDLMLREYFCSENNRNVDPVTGKPTFQ